MTHTFFKRIARVAAVAGALTAFASLQASAAPITTLFNTGVDAGGAVVAHDTIGDAHYTLTTVPGGTTTTRAITSAGGFPIGPWIGDNAISRWIGPDNDSDLNGPPGRYVYRTTFDLTGLSPVGAVIQGRWSTDNLGSDIRLNGVLTGNSSAGFTTWSNFLLNTGFVAGVNTLDFLVGNLPSGNNPTGLRVEFQRSFANPVPLPAALPLLAGALGLFGFVGRRRRHKAE